MKKSVLFALSIGILLSSHEGNSAQSAHEGHDMEHSTASLATATFASSNTSTSAIIDSYLALKDALVSSDLTKSTAAISELSKSIASAPDFPQKKELIKQTEAMAKAGDLEKQRAAFAGLSVTVWEAAKSQKWANQELFYQYCPMKKSYWLSTESEIRNPYYGSKMLACGSVKETLPAKN